MDSERSAPSVSGVMSTPPLNHGAPLWTWLCRPASWSWSQKFAVLSLVCLALCLWVRGFSVLLADILAFAAYLLLFAIILLKARHRPDHTHR